MKNILILLFIAAFYNAIAQEPTPIVYLNNGNKIVFLDCYYSDFQHSVNKDSNLYKIYKDKVKAPIMKYFANSTYADLVKRFFFFVPVDTIDLATHIDNIKTNRVKIEELITAALAKCNTALKDDSMTIYIIPAANSLKYITAKMGGVMAVTAGAKQIVFGINTDIPEWSTMLTYNTGHEYEHAYWTQTHAKDTDNTMLGYLLFEGRADSYAHYLYPDLQAPWTSTLTQNGKDSLWTTIKPKLNNEDDTFQHNVMFGSYDGKYPFWGGYCLGYTITQSALKNHPELTPVQWAKMKPEEILKMSDYK